MNGEYVPRGGSLAALVLAHLQTVEPGTRLTRREISEQFGVLETNITTCLREAVNFNVIAYSNAGRQRVYHLPEEVESVEGPLDIVSDHDGCLQFGGATVQNERVYLSRRQLRQLVTFATTPLVLLPDPQEQRS